MRQHLKGLTEKASTMVAMHRRTTRKKVPMQPTIVRVDKVDEDERVTLATRLCWTKSKK